MSTVSRLDDISGWLLPDGTWYPAEDWWHIAALYDLRDAGLTALRCNEFESVMNSGEESAIRDFAASKGFVKVSRCLIDGTNMTLEQLVTLQELIACCPSTEELGIVRGDDVVRRFSVERILKLRNSAPLFTATSGV